MKHIKELSKGSFARTRNFWPGLNKDIENKALFCENCNLIKKYPPKSEFQNSPWPLRPFELVHFDYLEFLNQYFMVILDAHSKWTEVFINKITDINIYN